MAQRYYDPQVGRFLSVDPDPVERKLGNNFNRLEYADSNPFKFVDPDGRKIAINGDASYKKAVKALLKELRKTKTGQALYKQLKSSSHVFEIKQTPYADSVAKPADAQNAQTPGTGTGGTLELVTTTAPKAATTAGDLPTPAWVVLGHEFQHFADFDKGTTDYSPNFFTGKPNAEEKARSVENQIRVEAGLPERVYY